MSIGSGGPLGADAFHNPPTGTETCFGRQALVPAEDLFDHFVFGWVEKRNYFHFAAALRTDHGVNLVDSLDEHGPSLAAASRWQDTCIILAKWFRRFFRLFSHSSILVGVESIVANNMRTFWPGTRAKRWSVLGAQFPGDAAAKKSSGDRIWKFRFAPASRSLDCGSGKA